jgi:hypothetical protein
MKNKILIDLDVLTVAEWEKRDPRKEIALKFLEDVRKKKFDAKTPVVLIKRIAEWEYNTIRDRIEDFYIKHAQILTVKDIKERIKELGIDDEKILRELENRDVKSEDAFLVLVVSIFDIDFLVTFN